MRTLCLNLHQLAEPAIAENFQQFSKRAYYREPGLIFLEISLSSIKFGGEMKLLSQALNLCREFYPKTTAAIADHPFTAQLFASFQPSVISPVRQDLNEISALPLKVLADFEGLTPWKSKAEVENIISFFRGLGLHRVRDIQSFSLDSFRERWGQTGVTLWKRLHGEDRQLIMPLQPADALIESMSLDFPVSLLPFLLYSIEVRLKSLFQRLNSRGEMARKVRLHLYCEYSNQYHLLEVKSPYLVDDPNYYMSVIEQQLSQLDLGNPIKDLELEIISTHKKVASSDRSSSFLMTGFLNRRDKEAIYA